MPARQLRPLLQCVAAVALLATSALASTLHGNLVLGRGSAGRAAELSQAVIWVENIPLGAEAQLARPPRIWFWQRWLGAKPPAPPPLPEVLETELRFQPRVSAAPAGGRIVFRNRDRVWHGVFSVTPGHRLEVGKRAPGSIDTLRVGRPGIVQLRCDIYPDMTGWVVVTPNHAFTRPDAMGHWELPELPAGRYVVRAWHPDRGALRREVTLAERDVPMISLRW